MVGRADPRVIVPANPDWNVIVSAPAVVLAFRIAWRREPAPALLRFETVKLAPRTGPWIPTTSIAPQRNRHEKRGDIGKSHLSSPRANL